MSSNEGAPGLSLASSESFDFEPILPNLSIESHQHDTVKTGDKSLQDSKSMSILPLPVTEKNRNGNSTYKLKIPPLNVFNNGSFEERVRKQRDEEEGSLFEISPRSFLMGRRTSKRVKYQF